MTPGAGFKNKPHRDAERMLSRNLEQVPKTYNQDVMPYRVSFHAQYAGGLATVLGIWIGLLILALLRLVLAYIPLKSSGLRYTISVSALFLLFKT